MILTRILQSFYRVYSSCPEGRWGSMDAWSDHKGIEGLPFRVILPSAGDEDWKNMQNTKHIRHTPVTAKQYLREQTARNKTQAPVSFWNTDQTNHDTLYNPYTAQTHVHELGHNMRPNNSDKHNQVHSNNNNSGKNNKSMDTQQDNVEKIIQDATG